MANGLLTNEELIDSLLVDLNTLPKLLMEGQNILFCTTISAMGQKLCNLKQGVKNDIESKVQTIEELKRQLRNANINLKEMSPEEYFKDKDGAENGAE